MNEDRIVEVAIGLFVTLLTALGASVRHNIRERIGRGEARISSLETEIKAIREDFVRREDMKEMERRMDARFDRLEDLIQPAPTPTRRPKK